MRREEQIMVFILHNAAPLMLVQPDTEEESRKRKRISLCPEEWADDFGEEFYEHSLENGFYYIAPDSEWNSQAQSIAAPGIECFESPTPESLQMSIEDLKRGVEVRNGE